MTAWISYVGSYDDQATPWGDAPGVKPLGWRPWGDAPGVTFSKCSFCTEISQRWLLGLPCRLIGWWSKTLGWRPWGDAPGGHIFKIFNLYRNFSEMTSWITMQVNRMMMQHPGVMPLGWRPWGSQYQNVHFIYFSLETLTFQTSFFVFSKANTFCDLDLLLVLHLR